LSVRKGKEIKEILGREGTRIKQYFHPHNTLNGIRFSLARFVLEPGKQTIHHKLKSSEVYYILEGEGSLFMNGAKFRIKKDDSVYVPAMSEQFIENIGKTPLEFLCVVDPAWRQEDEIILE